MQKCEITLLLLGFSSDVDSSENLRHIVKCLPMHLRSKWVGVAYLISGPARGMNPGRDPRFSDLAKFVDKKSCVASSMYGVDLTKENSQSKYESASSGSNQYNRIKVTPLAVNSKAEVKFGRKCICCSGTCSDVASCESFKAMGNNDRNILVQRLKLCINYLKGNHLSRACRKPKFCTVPDCTVKHHSLLHRWLNETDHTATQPKVSCAATNTCFSKSCLGIIPIVVRGERGNTCNTYALLDDGAGKSLCDDRLINALHLTSRPVTFIISTVSSNGSTIYKQKLDLHVKPMNGVNTMSL